MKASSPHRTAVAMISGLVAFDAVIFLVAALLHLGGRLSIGPVVLALGQTIPATVVEGIIGLLSLATTYGLVTRATWAWRVAIGTHVFTLAGVLVGLRAVTFGSRSYRALNVATHEVMLAAVVVGLILLLIPGVRAALQHTNHGTDVQTAGV